MSPAEPGGPAAAGPPSSGALPVAAVVVTYRRPRLATEVVRSLLEREALDPKRIVLVVNGEGGLDDPALEPQIHVVRLPENLGPAGGFREGMRAAAQLPGVEWFYLCEDDVSLFDLPAPRLRRLVEDAKELVATGSAPIGAIVAYGRDLHRRSGHTTVHQPASGSGYEPVDTASWGASLVARAVLEAEVIPSDDYFFGYEDFDFWYQMRRAGFEMLLDCASARRVASQMTLDGRDGAFSGERPTDRDEPWRAFYVARNYFLLARRHGSPSWIAAHLAYSLRRLQLGRSPAERAAIVQGLAAGALGRRGKDERYVRDKGELDLGTAESGGAAAACRDVPAAAPTRRRVVHVLPCDVARGAQVFARDLRDLLDCDLEEHLILTLFEAPPAVLRGSRSLAVPMGMPRAAGFDPRVPPRLHRALRELRPDVIVAHGGEPLKYLALVPRGRCELVYLAIGTVTGAARHGARRALYSALLARADLLVGVSADTVQELQRVFRRRAVLLANGRDATVYHPPAGKPGETSEACIIFVGHLTKTKRPERFVEAIEQLGARGQRVRGVIVGDGPLEASLRRRASSGAVEVLGRRDDVPALLGSADVFAFCSLPESEGMPGVLIEAALSGLPIVTTDVPGASDVVLDGVTGFVVPAGDQRAFVEALARLVDDPALRSSMGKAARCHAEASFDLATVAARWRAALEGLARHDQPPRRSQPQRRRGPGPERERPRVLHLIKSLSLVGGAEQLLLSLTTAEAAGSRFEYHVAHVVSNAADEFVGALRKAGVRVHDIGVSSHFDLRWLQRLRRLLVTEQIDIIHLHLPYAASLGRLVSRSIPAGPRIVHTQHNIWRHNVPVVRALHRATYWLDDADVAVSHAVWDALPRRLRHRTEVLVHGLPLEALPEAESSAKEVREEFAIAADEVIVTIVANMRREKGYEVLLEAARILVEAGSPARFLAVGSGPLEEETRRARDELGLTERFTMTGFRPDAQRIVAGSDLFVLASHHEGFPVAVMEALALGVPVISTAVGDVPSVVEQSGCGIIVPPGDAAALARAIGSLLTDPDRRAAMARAAKEAGQQFDIGRTAARLEEIYGEVLAAGTTAHPELTPDTPRATTGT